jgi:hypothetical protein
VNWIEIDKILYGIIARHDAVEDMLKEAEKQFKWNRSQSEAAVKPLLNRHTFKDISTDKTKVVASAAKGAINKTRKGK